MSNKYGSVNPVLLGLALKNAQKYTKEAFVAAGDPAMTGGDPAMAGGAPPMDPAMAGGAPPMDPAMMDPAMMDPAMAGGAPPMDPAMMQPIIDQAVQAALAAQGGGGAGAGGGAPKAKKFDPEEIDRRLFAIDTNLAKIADALGVTLSPSDVVTPPAGETGPTQDMPPAEEAAGPQGASAIQPISPLGAAFPKQGSADMGVAIDPPEAYKDSVALQQETADKASAWLKMASSKNAS